MVGVSHKTAPVSVLERLALDAEAVGKLVRDVAESDHVVEATALATCNRVEIYADVDRFHGSVEAISLREVICPGLETPYATRKNRSRAWTRPSRGSKPPSPRSPPRR